jgi:hypothetical protein
VGGVKIDHVPGERIELHQHELDLVVLHVDGQDQRGEDREGEEADHQRQLHPCQVISTRASAAASRA